MKLAWNTFLKFDAPDYSREGIQNFRNFVNDEMDKRCKNLRESIEINRKKILENIKKLNSKNK